MTLDFSVVQVGLFFLLPYAQSPEAIVLSVAVALMLYVMWVWLSLMLAYKEKFKKIRETFEKYQNM